MHLHSKTNNRKIASARSSWFSRVGRDPMVDWMIIVLSAFIMIGVVVYVGVSAYLDTSIAVTYTPTKSLQKPKPPIDTTELDWTVQILNSRIDFKPSVSVGDPSI
jgi:hypothetical protein